MSSTDPMNTATSTAGGAYAPEDTPDTEDRKEEEHGGQGIATGAVIGAIAVGAVGAATSGPIGAILGAAAGAVGGATIGYEATEDDSAEASAPPDHTDEPSH